MSQRMMASGEAIFALEFSKATSTPILSPECPDAMPYRKHQSDVHGSEQKQLLSPRQRLRVLRTKLGADVPEVAFVARARSSNSRFQAAIANRPQYRHAENLFRRWVAVPRLLARHKHREPRPRSRGQKRSHWKAQPCADTRRAC